MKDAPLVFSNPAANIIRGALGFSLYRVSPAIYEILYSPQAAGPSGLHNPPRPFVLRARALDECIVLPGETFSFALHLFAENRTIAEALQQSVDRMAQLGFGPARSRSELLSFETDHRALELEPAGKQAERIKVHFQSPTELKDAGQLMLEPDFAPLFRRVLTRISMLQSLYGSGPPLIGSVELLKQASAVTKRTSEIQHVVASRRSSRTGQEHPLGGFIGWAAYEGLMAEVLPYLEVGEWTGVGRQTTWGKGEIKVEIL